MFLGVMGPVVIPLPLQVSTVRIRRKGLDHDATRFRLVGAHVSASCEGCHPNRRYRGAPKDCQSCHALEDAHAGRFGNKCSTCHEPSKWKQVVFNHDRNTRFPLRGTHRDAECASCHKGEAGNGHVDVVRTLLDGGASPRLYNREGKTAQMLAERAEHPEVVHLLEIHVPARGKYFGLF
jgi:hypothetical protein